MKPKVMTGTKNSGWSAVGAAGGGSTFDYQIAMKQQPNAVGSRTVGLLNTVKGNFIALQYKTRIVDESLGVYDIEVTNYVDTKTFKEKKAVPSLMSMA